MASEIRGDPHNLTLAPSHSGKGDNQASDPTLSLLRARSRIRAATHHEDAALGAYAYAVDVRANELRRTDRLIDGRAFVKVRVELLALVEREIHLDGVRGRDVGVL